MKIRVIACCKNEEEMLPFFLQYYSKVADSIVIHDGGSTDNSHSIIRACPKAKLIVTEHSQMDERALTWIRNTAYKEDKMLWDWQIVVDIDEFLYHKDLLGLLEKYQKLGITIPVLSGYDMYSLEFPTFDEKNTIVDKVRTGRRNSTWQDKRAIFNPREIEINYDLGCHTCNPTGRIVESPMPEIALLHFNYVGYDHFIKRHRFTATRMSDFNRQHNLAYHIPMFAKMTREEFERKVHAEAQNLLLD